MVADDRLWVGTGSGAVLIFTVSRIIAETEAVIEKLARDTDYLSVPLEGSGDTIHGLVTTELAAGDPQDGSRASEQAEKRGYFHNRRTAFGRTLRGPSTKKAEKSPAIFQLEFENSYQLAESEPVRILLSMW